MVEKSPDCYRTTGNVLHRCFILFGNHQPVCMSIRAQWICTADAYWQKWRGCTLFPWFSMACCMLTLQDESFGKLKNGYAYARTIGFREFKSEFGCLCWLIRQPTELNKSRNSSIAVDITHFLLVSELMRVSVEDKKGFDEYTLWVNLQQEDNEVPHNMCQYSFQRWVRHWHRGSLPNLACFGLMFCAVRSFMVIVDSFTRPSLRGHWAYSHQDTHSRCMR